MLGAAGFVAGTLGDDIPGFEASSVGEGVPVPGVIAADGADGGTTTAFAAGGCPSIPGTGCPG
jgi:hypothetical protein